MKKYCVIGNDNRNVEIRRLYRQDGIVLVNYDMADIIIAPIPFSRDGINITGEIIKVEELIEYLSKKNAVVFSGAISNDIKKKLKQENVKYYDLMDMEEIAIYNAIATSEGAISIAIKNTDFNLHLSNVLVMGYGRIGKVLSKMLEGIGCRVSCEARAKKDIALIDAMGYNSININELEKYLPNMDVIFNTIPSLVLDKKRLQLLNKNCLVIDLASSPGGVDFQKAKELGVNVMWELSIPVKVASKSSALYLKTAIDSILEEGE